MAQEKGSAYLRFEGQEEAPRVLRVPSPTQLAGGIRDKTSIEGHPRD